MNWRENKRYLIHKNYAVKVKRIVNANKTKGHNEQWLENLEASQTRPKMEQTLKVVSHKKVLLVEGLYRGTRRMIEKLTTDAQKMQKAERFLRSYT
jgi:16S rRNA U516 pseudouridylate synthase RsuA-like enzyme